MKTKLPALREVPLGSPAGTTPITPSQHGLLDYAQSAMLIAAPDAFGLTGSTAALTRAFGVIQLAVNALSDHRYAVQPVLPFRVHGLLEKWSAPLFALAAFLTSGRQPKNFSFLLGHTILATTVFKLTDWNGDTRK